MLAVISGAGAPAGIGMACARALGRAGCRLVISGTSGRIVLRQAELAAEGFDVKAHQGDLSDPVEVARLAALAGEVDVLVNLAAAPSTAAQEMTEMGPEAFSRAMDSALSAAVLVTRALMPGMKRRGFGRVIMVASVAGPALSGPILSPRGESAYSVTRAALFGLTRALALEAAPSGVTVNAVAPGWIAPDAPAEAETATPMRRAGTPAEVAHAVRFLAARDASFITGATLIVDGGTHLKERTA